MLCDAFFLLLGQILQNLQGRTGSPLQEKEKTKHRSLLTVFMGLFQANPASAWSTFLKGWLLGSSGRRNATACFQAWDIKLGMQVEWV